MRTHFDEILKSKPYSKFANKDHIKLTMYMSLWYGELYVVIEGWKSLGLKDEIIDDLIQSDNVKLLKKFRNGVFHFQKRYNDSRFEDFYEKGIKPVDWVRKLNSELGRYFLDYLRKRGFSRIHRA